MKHRSIVALFAAVALGVPTASPAASSVDCANDRGEDRLSIGTASYEFEAPVVAAPELAATAAETGPLVTRHRTARFFFVVDSAPYSQAILKARVDWTTLSDYDLYVHDEFGDLRERSDQSNIDDGQTLFEALSTPVSHCERISISVRNWAGVPGQPLKLSLDLEGQGPLLACTAGDTAAGCAGKAEGEAPDPVADKRRRVYLGGAPGQAAMVGEYQYAQTQEAWPLNGTLSDERPTSGTPNQHTRALVGFRNQRANPLVAHFTLAADQLEIDGAPTAMIFASSNSTDATANVIADLYADGALVASSTITGDDLVNMRDPVPLWFSFPEIEDLTVYESLQLQIGTDPVATSAGATGNPADAQFTLWYGSAQFQSRLTLP